MLSPSHRSRIAVVLLIALFVTLVFPAAAIARGKTPPAAATTPQDKKESKPKDDKSALSKHERKWLEVFKFSKDRYQTNADFRQEVDEAYKRMQREHSEYAFSINVRDPRGEQVKVEEDRIKISQTLYDNPLAQDYVNRVGQSLVPANSDKLYAFKIMLNPIPEARSLSTGTVYVSTGLLSSIDNEAQLAYVLGHEIAHVEREHWKDDVLVAEGVEDWNQKQQQKRERFGLAAKIGLGVATMGMVNAGNFGAAGATMFVDAAMPSIFKLAMPNAVVAWDRQQEDEADQMGLKYMLDRKYDAREVPKFYAKLKGTSNRDKRAGLGFIASAIRIADREAYLIPLVAAAPTMGLYFGAFSINMQRQTSQAMDAAKPAAEKKPDEGKALDPSANSEKRGQDAGAAISGELAGKIKELLDAGELIGSSAEFQAVMAGIRRDNGIRAYYYDMFLMARENLEESLRIRSNDPYAHYYYGKVLKLTARNLAEKSRALNEFALAVQYDKRKVLAEPYLYKALAMIDSKESQTREIIDNLKEYVQLYQKQHAGALPSNMDVIYDYMQEAGETAWAAIPAQNVSTKNIEPIGVTQRAGMSQVSSPAPSAAPAPEAPKTPGRRRP